MRLLFLALLIALDGCSSFAADDYCPLHVGDEWTYEIAHVHPKERRIKSSDHSRIRGTTERNGKTYFVFEQWGKDPAKKQGSSYVRKDENGVHTTSERATDGAEVLWLSFPLKKGASWKYDEDTTCTVTGLENVAIKTKTYKNCYHVVLKTSDRHFTSDMWIAPNVGLVKSEDAFANGGKRRKTLFKFKPAH